MPVSEVYNEDCLDLGFDFYGFELDKDYFDASCKRFEQFKSQLKMF